MSPVTTTPLALPVAADVATPSFASWGRRVVAALLDGAVLGAVAWFAVGDGVVGPSLQPTFDSAGPEATAPWTSSGVLVAAWLAMLVLQGLTGQTPGRRVLDIAVVRAPAGGPVGGRPGVLRSVVRWFAHLLDAILLLGYLRPLWHAERRTFADSLVGTAVVRCPPPRPRDGKALAVTIAAWVVVLLGLAFGVRIGESGGVDRGAQSVCRLDGQVADAPVQVRAVVLVRETEWDRAIRLWPWADETRTTERERLSLEVSWDVTGEVGPEAQLLARTTAGGSTVHNEVSVDQGWASFPVERAGAGPVDVDVAVDGRSLTTCTAQLPPTG